MNPFTFTPVGVVRCANRYKYEAARQGVFTPGNQAVIEMFPGHDYETALSDLDGFERIWVLFVFDRNADWKPKVSPPITGGTETVRGFCDAFAAPAESARAELRETGKNQGP